LAEALMADLARRRSCHLSALQAESERTKQLKSALDRFVYSLPSKEEFQAKHAELDASVAKQREQSQILQGLDQHLASLAQHVGGAHCKAELDQAAYGLAQQWLAELQFEVSPSAACSGTPTWKQLTEGAFESQIDAYEVAVSTHGDKSFVLVDGYQVEMLVPPSATSAPAALPQGCLLPSTQIKLADGSEAGAGL